MKLKNVGKIVDAHGIKGELKIKFFSSDLEWLDDLMTVVIDGQEYDIENLRLNKTFWILKLHDLDDRNQSELLKGKDLLADESLFITDDDDDNPYLSELQDFTIDLQGKNVGQVHSFKETHAHFLIVIENDSGFYEIPYVDAFIEKIDRDLKTVFMSFPEDLLSEDFKLKEPQ